jgi:hypothetical protein
VGAYEDQHVHHADICDLTFGKIEAANRKSVGRGGADMSISIAPFINRPVELRHRRAAVVPPQLRPGGIKAIMS